MHTKNAMTIKKPITLPRFLSILSSEKKKMKNMLQRHRKQIAWYVFGNDHAAHLQKMMLCLH